MARKKAAEISNGEKSGESIAGYFRTIFKENPKLLKGRSNEELLRRWLTDHPEYNEVPPNVKSSLSNIKSVLRSKKRKGGRPRKTEEAPVLETVLIEVPEPDAIDL